MTISRRQTRILAALFVLGLAALLVTLSVSQARPVQAANCDRSNLSFTNLCLASLSVIDGNGTSVDIGTFSSDGTSYSGDVASSVDQVTVYAAAMAEELTTVSILPSDSHTDSGHQVRLNHGTNLISISVISGFPDGGIKTYSVAINRAGSAPNNDEVTEVSISGLEWAKEGHTMPFLLTRTGDTTQALTVPVDVSETGGDMVSSSLEGRFDVNFQAGYASARHDLETNADTVWEEHSTVTVAPVDGTGYDVSGSAGVASAEMRDNDFPAATAVLTVDSTEVEEGEEVTATITVTTDAAQKPHGYGGDLKLKTEFSAGPGAAESEDVVFRGINDGHKAVSEPSFKPVMTGGVITAYESVYSASITIVDDETWEEAETFNVVMEIRESAGALTSDALKLDTTSTPHMVTIAAHEEDLPVQQSPMSHITVVTEDFGDSGTTFTITWEDVDDCSTVYSAILGTVGKFSDGSGNSALVYNLGRVTSDATQITKSLPEVQDLGSGFTVSLYCADGGSYVHQLVAKVSIPPTTQESSERPLPGTYSTEPPLTGLTVSHGTLNPAFSSGSFIYVVPDVTSANERITVTPAAKTGYTLSWVFPVDADLHTDGHQVDLREGLNNMVLLVSHVSGFSTSRYDLTVKRATAGQQQEEQEDVLEPTVSLELSPPTVPVGTAITVTMTFANLESDSDTSDTDYIFRADVVNADLCENQADGYGLGVERYMYKVDEDPEVRTGSISTDCPAGGYTVRASISSPDNMELASDRANFSVVQPEPPSADATLSGLALSGVDFGAFESATNEYTASVANDVTETTVTPTTNDDGATHAIKLGSVANEDGIIPLAVGSNVITVKVTAEDGQATKNYAVTVTRAEPPTSGPAVAIGLSPSGSVAEGTEITVTMTFANLEFDSDTSDTDYIFRADVVDADQCENQAGGYGLGVKRYMSKVDEDPETRRGSISAACPPGDYTLEVSISSPDNVELASATADFTITGPAQQQQDQEPPPSTDATLSNLALSDVNVAFASTTTEYTASVVNSVTQTTVTPTTNDGGATYTVKLGGVAYADGVISLAVGSNVITIEITAEDGNTAETYTVTVTRAEPLSADATLSGLTLSGLDIGKFDPDTTGYTAGVGNDISETTVTPTVNDDGATYVLKLDGMVDEDGTVSLAVGENVVAVEVTAEDGDTTKTYEVSVTRAEAPPELADEATLSALALSGVTLAFDPATDSYDVSVAHDVEQTTVTATPNHDGATYAIKLDGQIDADGTVDLAVGENVISIVVTAEDGETARTYTVTVTRAEPPLSTDATLKGLALSGAALEPAFDADTTGYTAQVGNDVEQTTVTATTSDANATYVVQLDGVDDADGTVELAVGENAVTIEVTAEDGNATRTYTVTVTRAEAPPEPDPTDEPAPTDPPDVPDKPTGEVTGKGQVRLEWNDVAGTDSYDVRYFDDQWMELPTGGISIVFDGSGAQVSGLKDWGRYYFSVRAVNGAGVSEWSEHNTMNSQDYY